MNRLSLVFGNSTASASATLAIFMAGIFIGSFLMKKRAGNYANTLFIYGLLEIGIGLSALFFLVLLTPVQRLYNLFYDAVVFKPFILFMMRFSLASLLILLPTFCMGATVPLFTLAFMRRGRLLHSFSWVYFLNSLGGAIGVAIAGFYFFEHLGFKGTYGLAFGINLLVGISAIFIATRYNEQIVDGYSHTNPSSKERVWDISYPSWLLYTLFFTTGFISFSLEILWFRFCALFFGSSTYSFSSVLFVVILGIALGALIASKTPHEKKIALLSWSLTLLACSLILTFPLINFWPRYVFATYSLVFKSFYAQIARNLLYTVLFMGIPALSFGLIFPLALFHLEQSKIVPSSRSMVDDKDVIDLQVGKSVSLAYALNTLGCVSGSLLTGLLLLQLLGSQNCYILFTFLAIALCISSLIYCQNKRRIWCGLALALCVFLGLNFKGINKSLLQAGLFRYAKVYVNLVSKYGYKTWEKALQERDKILFFEEGTTATVNVISQPGNYKCLKINGKPDGSIGIASDMESFFFIGMAPYLVRPYYESVGIIGLGTGLTAATVYELGAGHIDIMEIAQEVVNAQPYFEEENRSVYNKENVQIILEDGRNYLQGTRKKYDLIISQPSNPWVQGVASLFTDEFYQIIKNRLNPGGIFVQWIQTYETSKEVYYSLIKTLHHNFPYILLFEASTADVILVASLEEQILNPQCLSAVLKNKSIQRRLRRLGMNSAVAILRRYLDKITPAQRYSPKIKLHTDNNLFVQYKAPKLLSEEKKLSIEGGSEREKMIKNLPKAYLQDYVRRVRLLWWVSRNMGNLEKKDYIQTMIKKLNEEDRELIRVFNEYSDLQRKIYHKSGHYAQKELLKFIRANPLFFNARGECISLAIKNGDMDAVCDNLELYHITSQDLKTALLLARQALKVSKEKGFTITKKHKEFFKIFINTVKTDFLTQEEKITVNQIEQMM